MQDITRPLVKLSAANAELITQFAQSPEIAELAASSAQKYFELAQKSFGQLPAASAQADLVRRLAENYAVFAKEYSESLMGLATDAQTLITQQVKAATEQAAQGLPKNR
jgi:hypothetical protein